MYEITLPNNFSEVRYGITFFKGVGRTYDERLASRLQEKGFRVDFFPDLDSELKAVTGSQSIESATVENRKELKKNGRTNQR